MKPTEFEAGDRVTWRDDDCDPPVQRVGTVVSVLSCQYVVATPSERFVFKTNRTLCTYKEQVNEKSNG